MRRINILDEHTANKIAAGEVVERPSSVVKELVENSIDANAKNITIEILDGGTNSIKIIDDGDGIYPEDIEIAFMPHATSKIRSVEDIYSIGTLGFRGEALPSISAVAKVICKSRNRNKDIGKEISIEAGKTISLSDTGMNMGTILEVQELFYNIPARKKFLKSISRESSLVNDIITRIALSNPDISFTLTNNGKKILSTLGNGNLKDCIRAIYGKNIYDNIIEFEGHNGDINVYGYIGTEDIAKGSRNNQSIFVNKRYIKNKTIVAAVENAFKSFSALNKFPFFVVFIDIPSELVDVNIHPTKAEIKFNDDRIIFKLVFDSVHKAIKEKISTSFIENEPNDEVVDKISFDFEEKEEVQKPSVNLNSVYENVTSTDVKREEEIYENLKSLGKQVFEIKENNLEATERCKPISTIDNHKDNRVEDSIQELYKKDSREELYNSTVDVKTKEAKFPQFKVIGQFRRTYILCECDETLYIIDQHAAHEKILYEEYIQRIENDSLIVQPLLVPEVIDLTLDDYSYYEENQEIFKNAGFVIEPFGGNTVTIKEVPYFLGKVNSRSLFLDIIENLKVLGSGKTIEVKINKIASMACRTAIKANDQLSIIEMEELINQLRFINDPFHCPHGRPVIIKFTEYELNKRFRRII